MERQLDNTEGKPPQRTLPGGIATHIVEFSAPLPSRDDILRARPHPLPQVSTATMEPVGEEKEDATRDAARPEE